MLAYWFKTPPALPSLTATHQLPEIDPASPRVRLWLRFMIFVGFYALSAWFSYNLSEDPDLEATFWLPIGLTIGVLIVAPRQHGIVYLAGLLTGDLAFNLITGVWPWPQWIATAAANLATVWTAAWAVKRWVSLQPALTTVAALFAVVGLAALSLIITSTVGAGMLMMLTETTSMAPFWFSWFFSDLVGVILMVPLIMVWTGRPPIHFTAQLRFEAAILFGAFLIVITGVVSVSP